MNRDYPKIFQFFIITPLYLEDLAIEELKDKWGLITQNLQKNFPESETCYSYILSICPFPKKVKGGIEVLLPAEIGLLLNLFLKIPVRILIRFTEFKCKAFPKLYQKLTKLPWNQYLKGQTPHLKISSTNSKLFDSRKIEKAFIDALQVYYRANQPKKIYLEENLNFPLPTLYIRFEEDLCTISFDSSGPELYKRDYKKYIGKAPLRENLAYALIYSVLKTFKFSTFPLEFIDPMAGTGTFVFEAASFHLPHLRDYFSFQSFPIFSSFQKNYQKLFCDLQQSTDLVPLFSPITAMDKESTPLEVMKKNSQCFYDLFPNLPSIQFYQEDLFERKELNVNKDAELRSTREQKALILLINPPYGKRLSLKGGKTSYFQNLIENILEKFSPSVFGVIIPSYDKSVSRKYYLPNNYQLKKIIPFFHGGLKLSFHIFKKIF